jgi:hypothetical protein
MEMAMYLPVFIDFSTLLSEVISFIKLSGVSHKPYNVLFTLKPHRMALRTEVIKCQVTTGSTLPFQLYITQQ